MNGAVSRRLLVVVAAMMVLLIAWVAFAGSLLVATDEIGEPDVVLALSGDPLGDRVRRAIDVAADTDAERLVIFLDGGPRPESPAQIRRRAVESGVPEEAIRFVGGVDSTAMEAGLAAGLVERCGWRDLVVVTSPYHTRRAGWTFHQAIGDAARVRTVASGEDFDETGWWRTHEGRLAVFREWTKGLGSLWYAARPPGVLDTPAPC